MRDYDCPDRTDQQKQWITLYEGIRAVVILSFIYRGVTHRTINEEIGGK